MARSSMWALVGVAGRACRQPQQRNRGTSTHFLHSALLCDGNKRLHSATVKHADILVVPPAAASKFNGGGEGGGIGIIRCRPNRLVAAAASVGALPWLLRYQAGGKRGSNARRGPDPTGTVQGSRGAYMFGRKLASGTFGEVYFGVTRGTLEPVAIKTMDNSVLKSRSTKSRVYVTREISAMMQVRHPNIISLLDVVYNPTDPNGKLCMVMEYMEGGTVYDYVTSWPGGRGLPERKARSFFQQLIDGVRYCHSMDIAHRDLKPANLLLNSTWDTLKIGDFGLSAIDISAWGGLKSLVGTPDFEAPEIVGAGLSGTFLGYDGQAADIWSCGVILYFLIAGFSPFTWGTTNVRQVQEAIMRGGVPFLYNLPPGARSLVVRMLERHPDLRITMSDIYSDPWFTTDYRAPDYKALREVKENLQAIENVFQMPTDPKYDTDPADEMSITLPRPPKVWVHKERPVDDFAFGFNTGTGEEQFVEPDASFKLESALLPGSLIGTLEETLSRLGCQYRTRQFTIHVYDARVLSAPFDFGFGEPLEMLIDVVPAPHSRERHIIHIRRVTGSRLQFDIVTHAIAKACEYFLQPI